MTHLTVYAYAGADGVPSYSPPCSKVILALARSGLEHTVKPVTGDPSKVSPTKRLPALQIGSEVLADSVRILNRLQTLDPPQQFWHDTPSDCLWEHFANDSLYWKLVTLRWGVPENLKRTKAALFGKFNVVFRAIAGRVVARQANARAKGQGTGLKSHDEVLDDLARCLDLVARAVEPGPFLDGQETPGRGDFALGGFLPQLTLGGITPRAAQLVHDRPEVVAYLGRVYEACRLPVPAGLARG